MNVRSLLKTKGTGVVKVHPMDTVSAVTGVLTRYAIGAVPVIDEDYQIVGIVSERDVVKGIASRGAAALDLRAKDLMNSPVIYCTLDSTIHEVMEIMTEKRLRHLPVVADGKLEGIISIGDVVKSRLNELRTEAQILRDQITIARAGHGPF